MASYLACAFGFLFLCVVSSPAKEPEPRSAVVVGQVVFIQDKTDEDRELEQSLYDHTDRSFFVVNVERVLSGTVELGPVIVGLHLYSRDQYVDSRVVIVLEPSTPQAFCGPLVLSSGAESLERSTVNVLGEGKYWIEELNAFRSAPVYCSAQPDIFVMR